MNKNSRISLFVIYDLAVFLLSVLIMVAVEKRGNFTNSQLLTHLHAFLFLIPCWILYFYIVELYRLETVFKKNLFTNLLRAVVVCTLLSFVFFYLFDFGITPKTNLIVFGITAFLGLYLSRRFLLKSLIKSNLSIKVSVLCESVGEIHEHLRKYPLEGYKQIEHIYEHDKEVSQDAELVVIDKNFVNDEKLLERVDTLVRRQKVRVKSYIDFYEEISGKISLKAVNSYWLLDHLGKHDLKEENVGKRLFDCFFTLLIFLVCSPFLIFGIALIFIFEGKPIFYSQERVGKGGEIFKILKLRTMVQNAEKNKAQWATPNDRRVTKIGKFLRKSRIDELPQLLNILRGEMSLVGPRPEREEIIKEKLEKLTPYYNMRHVVSPGVTGWAQVNYRYGYSEEDAMEKLKYDLYYIKNSSLLLDIKIILRTIRVVLTGLGQ